MIYRPNARRHAAGNSLIEFVLVTPILLVLALGVADIGRAILFNNILVNMTREGANLAARTKENREFIITALTSTAAPLDMNAAGMVYITRVSGVDDGSGRIVARVDDQYRAVNGEASLGSRFWQCPGFASDGRCDVPSDDGERRVALPVTLGRGDSVYVVEALYRYTPMSTYVVKTATDFYSQTML